MSTANDPGQPSKRPKEPNVAIGLSLLVVAAVLIIVVLIQPAMAGWLKATIGIVAVAVVCALLAYAVGLWKSTRRGGPGR